MKALAHHGSAVALIFAGPLALLSLAGLVHAFRTRGGKTVATPQPARVAGVGPYFAGI